MSAINATRVLIVRVGAMGDVLHALPAVAALRELRPEAEIDWVVDPRWAPLLVNGEGAGPVVSRVFLAHTKLWSRAPVSRETMRSVLALRREVRERPYGAVVDMQGTLRSAVIASFALADGIAGYADPREEMARHFYRQKIERKGEHVVGQGAALLSAALGLTLQPAPVALPREGWAEAWADELIGRDRVAVLAASAGWGAKQWPLERYAELARALRGLGFRVLANAPRKDDALAGRLAELSAGAAETVVCNVAGLIALLRRAAVVVGGDSGPVHLAAALRVPVVALFGPTNPARNCPWGGGQIGLLRHGSSVTSYKRSDAVDPGLARIGADEVLAAVMGVVGGKGGSHSV